MESNCKKLENLEGFSQGHGLLFGQIHGSDQFNKPLQKIRNDDYSYEVVSGNTKEHVGEFIKINLELKEKNAGIVVQNIFIKIVPDYGYENQEFSSYSMDFSSDGLTLVVGDANYNNMEGRVHVFDIDWYDRYTNKYINIENASKTRTSSLKTKNSLERAININKTPYKYFELIIYFLLLFF